jgi:hypothetical protein
MRAAMKSINDLYAAAQKKTHTHQPSVTGTREGQTEWPSRTFTLIPLPTPSKPRTRMDMGLRTRGKRNA